MTKTKVFTKTKVVKNTEEKVNAAQKPLVLSSVDAVDAPFAKTLVNTSEKDNYFLRRQQYLIEPVQKPNQKRLRKLPTDRLVSKEQLQKLITSPQTDTLSNLTKLINLKESDYVFVAEDEKREKVFESQKAKQLIIEKQQEEHASKSAYELTNIVMSRNVIEHQLPEQLHLDNVKNVLIMTDSEYYQSTLMYAKLIKSLKANGIKYSEFTNIQPNLTKGLINKIATFALKEKVEGLLVFGSWSTIDLAKVVAIKFTKPNLLTINRSSSSVYLKSKIAIYSLPTIVCMDERINASNVIRMSNKLNNIYSDTISLLTPVDNSDCSFFYPGFLLELSQDKLLQVLYEGFFRSILNFFDKKISEQIEDEIVKNAKLFQKYAKIVKSGKELTLNDADKISVALISTVDGTTYLSEINQWRWFLLECGLSDYANCKKSDGLALFAPSYVKNEAAINPFFREKSDRLSQKLFGTLTSKGLAFEILRFNQEFDLPTSFFNISQIDKVDSKILYSLTRKGSFLFFSYKIVKDIIKDIPVY